MKSDEFLRLANKYAENTKRIRIGTKNWSSSGVSQMRQGVAEKIGRIIAFLEDHIKTFCEEDEFLMIYNFQLLFKSETSYWCSLDMVRRPLAEISDLGSYTGKPFQLGIEGESGQIVNDAYILQEMGENEDETEIEPICYGNFFDYADPKTSSHVQSFSEKLTTLASLNTTVSSTIIKTLSETKSVAETENQLQTNKKLKEENMMNDKKSVSNTVENRTITFAYDWNKSSSFFGADTCIADAMCSPSAMLSPFDMEDSAFKNAKMLTQTYCYA